MKQKREMKKMFDEISTLKRRLDRLEAFCDPNGERLGLDEAESFNWQSYEDIHDVIAADINERLRNVRL